MKQLLFTFAFLTSFISHAQWLPGEYIDELGKETGETFLHQTVSGTFSNSKMACSECTYFIEHNKKDKVLGVIIYPFGGEEKEQWKEDTFQDFQLITPKGKQVHIETFCLDGMMYFSEKEYKQLMRTIKGHGEYKVTCNYDDGNSISTYVFNFEN
jgi:hypothetical protein